MEGETHRLIDTLKGYLLLFHRSSVLLVQGKKFGAVAKHGHCIVTMAQSGRYLGLTQNTVTYLPVLHTTERLLFGKRRMGFGGS